MGNYNVGNIVLVKATGDLHSVVAEFINNEGVTHYEISDSIKAYTDDDLLLIDDRNGAQAADGGQVRQGNPDIIPSPTINVFGAQVNDLLTTADVEQVVELVDESPHAPDGFEEEINVGKYLHEAQRRSRLMNQYLLGMRNLLTEQDVDNEKLRKAYEYEDEPTTE